MKEKQKIFEIEFIPQSRCCNTESFGEICVKCKLCEKKVSEMSGAEYMELMRSEKIYNQKLT